MRISLGAVFLIFGIGKFSNDIWAETIRTSGFFINLPWNIDISVMLIGIIETLTGIALIIGLLTRLFAVVSAVQLIGILILLKFAETRDIGLLGMAAYIAIIDNDSFGIDWFWKNRKRSLL